MVAVAIQVAHADQPLAAATIVVFNSSLPESAELARFYAQKRAIPSERLVGLACSTEEEISRADYDRAIAEPLRDIFTKKKWWTTRDSPAGPAVTSNSIRIVALIKGMPLKVRAAPEYPGDKPGEGPIASRNESSVDSELAVLGSGNRNISGAKANPYFQSYRGILEGKEPTQLLVCRLDAPTATTVRQMITDAVETEKNGLWGRAYVDGGGNTAGGFEVGDKWFAETAAQFQKSGVPVVYENTPALLPDGFPLSDCALYYGWYAGDAVGPFTQPDFRFTPGAIALHIHSFSGASLRTTTAHWVGPLLTKGAAATVGNVYEPYLQLTTHPEILNDRLLHGFSFAESAYMATQVLSWMNIMVGDPLYRPYAAWLQLEAKVEPSKNISPWKMYRDFAVQNVTRPAPEYRTLARQAASRAKNGVMIEDLGLMEARDGNHAAATSHFQEARTLYTKRDDILRVVLEEADSWVKQEKPKRALELVRSVLKIVGDGPTAALLKKTETELSAKTGLGARP